MKIITREDIKLDNIVEVEISGLADHVRLMEFAKISKGEVALSVCRNGVYRSALSAQALRTGGVIIPKIDEQQGLSYEQLVRLVAFDEVNLDGEEQEGSISPSVIIVNIDPDSRSEIDEVQQLIGMLKDSVNKSLIRVVFFYGKEEDHLYY